MAILDRLKVGVVLTKDSLLLIRHHPRLLLFPLVGGLTGIAFLALFLGVTFGFGAIDLEAGVVIGLVLAYLVLTFVSSFFTAALVHQTRVVLNGGESSLRDGVAAAWDRKVPLLIWSLIAATISVAINAIENSNSRVAGLFAVLFSVAWTLLTFFIIPVIVFDRPSTTGMFKESARKFKQTYGETPISLIGIQLIAFLIAMPFWLPGLYLLTIDLIAPAIGLFLLGALAAFLLSQTLSGVVKTVLYLYAEDGTKPEEFDDVKLTGLNTGTSSTPGQSTSPGPSTGGFH